MEKTESVCAPRGTCQTCVPAHASPHHGNDAAREWLSDRAYSCASRAHASDNDVQVLPRHDVRCGSQGCSQEISPHRERKERRRVRSEMMYRPGSEKVIH